MTLETSVARTCGEAPRSAHETAFHGDGPVLTPASYDELSEVIRSAEASSTPLVPAGLGTHAYLGNPPPPGARVVSLRLFDQV
ncbi:MAG TPA: hypothetical protein VMT52_19015, partial [Planctomycetota bacterium]|nr:hypothetical protein [Planctomycetota bacterium]